MIQFTALDPRITPEHLGLIPMFLDTNSPLPASEQFDANYAHGGGWHPMDGWSLDTVTGTLEYEGDPPMQPYAAAKFNDELILVYPSSWVAIVQQDGSFEVSRMD